MNYKLVSALSILLVNFCYTTIAWAELTDIHETPNAANEGIKKSLIDQIGAGRGDLFTPDSSMYIIKRDPFRAISRGRQLFQRKFKFSHGIGPATGDGVGDIEQDASIGAGIADSCAACHGRPRGSAGFGGDVFTRPDSRDAPHLFGLGLVEMLADEVTTELRTIRDNASSQAISTGSSVVANLQSKGIGYGIITALPDGSFDTTLIEGVDNDLRVKPFFHEGSEFSIRAFVAGAFNAEMGLEAFDPDLIAASNGQNVVTPSGFLLSGNTDQISPSVAASETDDPDLDGEVNEIPASLVDFMEFYLLNYFRPATYEQTKNVQKGRDKFVEIGCAQCHVPDLVINNDRRVADVNTTYDATQTGFNHLFATAVAKFNVTQDDPLLPTFKLPLQNSFVVENIYTDLKRHDLGPAFWEKNFDGTLTKEFVTEPLWGVGSTAPYGHDGRSINLTEVILRHGGEAQTARDNYANMPHPHKTRVIEFLQSLVLFPPADTASNLNPGNTSATNYPQEGHGSIELSVLFNDPTDPE